MSPDSNSSINQSRCLALPQARPAEPALVLHARDGDPRALALLFERHLPCFTARAQARCYDPHAAEDIRQTACLSALQHLHQLRAPEAFCFWVQAHVVREALHWHRTLGKTEPAHAEDSLASVESLGPAQPPHFPCAREDLHWMTAALASRCADLPCSRRQIARFMLSHYVAEGEFPPNDTIARVTGASHRTVERTRPAIIGRWRRWLSASGYAP